MIEGTLTIDELAALTGVSTRWIAKLQRDGIVPAPTKGAYPAEESIKRLFGYYRSKGGEGDGKLDKLDSQRARLTKSKADIADFQRKRMIGEYVERARVIASITSIIAIVTARLLAIPTKIAQRLATTTKAADCEELTRKAIEEALENLSQLEIVYRDPPKRGSPNGARGARGVQAATEANGF